jgi:hypothetical protein
MFRFFRKLAYAWHNWRYFGVFSSKECELIAHGLRTLPNKWQFGDPTWIVVSEAPDLAYLSDSRLHGVGIPVENVSGMGGLLTVCYVDKQTPIWEQFGIPSALRAKWPRNVENAEKARPCPVGHHDLWTGQKKVRRLNNGVDVVVSN